MSLPALTFREKVQKDLMMDALRKTQGNVSLAAKLLDIPRSTFYNRLKNSICKLRVRSCFKFLNKEREMSRMKALRWHGVKDVTVRTYCRTYRLSRES